MLPPYYCSPGLGGAFRNNYLYYYCDGCEAEYYAFDCFEDNENEEDEADLELDGRKKEDEKEDEEDLMIAGHAKLFARTEELHMPLLQLMLQQQQQIEHKIAKLLTRLPA